MHSTFSDRLKHVLRDSTINSTNADGTTILRDEKTCFVITGLPPSSIVVKMEKIGHLNTLEGRKLRWRCDYLISVAHDDHDQIILLETKKTLHDSSRPKEQIRRSIPILKYLVSLCEIENERSWNIIKYFSVIAEKDANRLDKQPTHVEPGLLSRLENYKGIDISFVIGTEFSLASLTSAARR